MIFVGGTEFKMTSNRRQLVVARLVGWLNLSASPISFCQSHQLQQSFAEEHHLKFSSWGPYISINWQDDTHRWGAVWLPWWNQCSHRVVWQGNPHPLKPNDDDMSNDCVCCCWCFMVLWLLICSHELLSKSPVCPPASIYLWGSFPASAVSLAPTHPLYGIIETLLCWRQTWDLFYHHGTGWQ